ncbi:hypothetical protein PMM47T1_24064 [Pseudomonas sp. M47T1]|nr:hypothetical protein PMM47T1_24064 [Pseudomonas sp. M47T1]
MQNVRVRFAYKRGFRRAWLVLSVVWLCLTSTVFLSTGNPLAADMRAILLFGVAPALVLYVCGAAFVWILEGFARPD